MSRVHVVQQGETIVSISERYGFFAETVWDHPDNAELKNKRGRPDVLLPGDEVAIPELRAIGREAATGRRHVFRRRGVPAMLRLVLREKGVPQRGVEYELVVGGERKRGRADQDGLIEVCVPASATEGRLYVGGSQTPMLLRFGHMDPIDTVSGVRKRLSNLGLGAPAGDDLATDAWRSAIGALQGRAGLRRTGELDDETRRALEKLHDDLRGGGGGQS